LFYRERVASVVGQGLETEREREREREKQQEKPHFKAHSSLAGNLCVG
jgi:hypothetical protein